MHRTLAGGRGEIVTSRLSLLEVRSKPLRDGDQRVLGLYDNLFRRATLVEVAPAVIQRATELRARYALSSADAIHLASAMHVEADSFLTNDGKLARVSEKLNVIVVR